MHNGVKQRKGEVMVQGVYSRGKRKAEFQQLKDGRYVLDVSERVKVSEHRNVFKNRDALAAYLGWLFGKYEIREG